MLENTMSKFQFRANGYKNNYLDDFTSLITKVYGWAIWDATLEEPEDDYDSFQDPGIFLAVNFKNGSIVTVTIPEEELLNMVAEIQRLKRSRNA